MVEQIQWFDRKFNFDDLHTGLFPGIVERLRGAPARLEESLRGISNELLKNKPEGKWSIKEEAGHLYDLEELWSVRLEGLLSDEPEIIPADLTNRKTHEAAHNSKSTEELLSQFRISRMRLVQKLDALSEDEVLAFSIHPRLKTKMRVIDLCYFVAEHDDHHLASITAKKML